MKQTFINSPNKRLFTYFICFIFFYFNSPVLFGQHHTCGHDHVIKEMIKDKDAVEKYKAFEKVIYDKTINENTQYKTGVETYTIPVVVHVVHESSDDVIGTGTNIASSRVDLAIEHLNDAFNNDQNHYTNALGVNTNIRFCLEGITRTSNDTYTNINLDSGEQNSIGNATGNWNAWSTVDYLNIWVVNEVCNDPGNDDCNGCPNNTDACNVAGYAWFPSSTIIGATKDGAVMEDQTFGVSPQGSVVLIHEVGHYLGLYHTFEGGCATPLGDCLLDGDLVCDTPPDDTGDPTQGCTSTGTCSGNDPEMFENYMDYGNTSCKDLFSEGQGTRMRLTLENIRASLLVTEACTYCGIDAAFDYSIDVNTVHFTNNSTVGPGTVTYTWDFGDGNTSNQESPTHSYDDLGTYFVCFTISTNDNGDICTETKHTVIEIVCPPVLAFEITSNGSLISEMIGLNETFTVQSLNDESVISEYLWDFGDGTILSSSNINPVTHSYVNIGLYDICLTVTYTDGGFQCIESYCTGIEVFCPITPSYEISVNSVLSTGVLNINDPLEISSTSTGNISEYYWDLGDGTTYTNMNDIAINHTYPIEGFYEICLTTTFSVGSATCQETICECIRVDAPPVTSPEICNNGIDDDGDGLVDCFDDECCGADCEDNYYNTCVTTCDFPSFIADFSMEIEENMITAPYDWHNYNIAVTGNVDCDPQPEIIGKIGTDIDNNMVLYVLDGITRELEHTITTNLPMSRANSVAIGDVDNDGKIEIIGVGGYIPTDQNPMSNQIFCYEISCNAGQISHVQKWLSPVIGYPGTGDVYSTSYPNIADFNGDGQAEVYMLNQIYDGVSGQLLTEGGAENHVGAMSNTSIGGTAIAVDILDDDFCTDCEGMELVVGGQIYSVYIDNDCGDYRMTVELEVSGPLGQDMDGHTSIVDYDNNNTLDVIVSRVEGNMAYIFVWDIASNTILSDITFPVNETFNGRFGIARVTPANYDDDPEIELAVVSANELRFIDQNAGAMTVAQTIDVADQSGGTGVVVYDFEGDGKNEIVYRDEGDLMVFQFNNGQYETVLSKPCSSGTAGEYPVVVDVDGDGETEIVCSCGIGAIYNGNGEIRVYGSNSFPWVPTRQVWNQYNYSTTNINDDLTIPVEQQQTTFITDGTFNAFPFQYSILNTPIPDAIIADASYACNADDMEVTLSICNDQDDSSTLSFETNISIYNGDPMSANTDVDLLEVFEIQDFQTNPTNLAFDECIEITVTISDPANEVYIVVNDNNQFIQNEDGSVSYLHTVPYADTDGDGMPDFPLTPIAECDYTNNLWGPIINGCCNATPLACELSSDNCNMVCNPEFCTSQTPTDFCDNAVAGWMDSHGTPTYVQNGGLGNNAGAANLRVTIATGTNFEVRGQGVEAFVDATGGQDYIFSMYKMTISGTNQTRVLLANNERGADNGTNGDTFMAGDGCQYPSQNVFETDNSTNPSFEVMEIDWTDAANEANYNRYVSGFQLNAGEDFEDLIIYPSNFGNNSASETRITRVELIPDYFTAGEDVTISCLETVTLGDFDCELTDVTYTWTNMNTGEVLVTNASSPQLMVNPSETTTYQIVRNIGFDNNADNVVDLGINLIDEVEVIVVPLDISFSISNNTPAILEDVVFTPSIIDFNNKYTWDLGDGTTYSIALNNPTTTHFYESAGAYEVCLTVININNPACQQTICEWIIVNDVCSTTFQSVLDPDDSEHDIGKAVVEMNDGNYFVVGVDGKEVGIHHPILNDGSSQVVDGGDFYFSIVDPEGDLLSYQILLDNNASNNTDGLRALNIYDVIKQSDGSLVAVANVYTSNSSDSTPLTSDIIDYGVLIVKFDVLGNLLWTKIYSDADELLHPYQVIENSNNEIVVACGNQDEDAFEILTVSNNINGSFEAKSYDLLNSNLQITSLVEIGDDEYIIVGKGPNFNIARIDNDLSTVVWSKRIEDPVSYYYGFDPVEAQSVLLNGPNEILVTSLLAQGDGSFRIYLHSFDLEGSLLSSRRLDINNELYSIINVFSLKYHRYLDTKKINGGYVIRLLTQYKSPSTKPDVYLIKLNTDYSLKSAYKYGGDNADITTDIMVTSDNHVVLVGGSRSYSSDNNWETYILKTDHNGESINCEVNEIEIVFNNVPTMKPFDVNAELGTSNSFIIGNHSLIDQAAEENIVCSYNGCCDPYSELVWMDNLTEVNLLIDGVVSIPDGTTVVVKNSTLRFTPNGKIEVAPTGRLIIQKSILTRDQECGTSGLWQGIELLSSTSPTYATGTVRVEQNSLIEYAETAIHIEKGQGQFMLGGTHGNVIEILDSKLFNNEYGVNVVKANTTDVQFKFNIVNNYFINNDPVVTTEYCIKLNQVRMTLGVQFESYFTNNQFSNANHGIAILNASRNHTCLIQENDFDNIANWPINVTNTWVDNGVINNTPNYVISSNRITASKHGVKLRRLRDVIVKSNEIAVDALGIEVIDVSSYSILHNVVESNNDKNTWGVGIRLYNSNLSEYYNVGILPIEQNYIKDFKHGLFFKNYKTGNHEITLNCNEFNNNSNAILLQRHQTTGGNYNVPTETIINPLGNSSDPVQNSFISNDVDINTMGNATNCILQNYYYPVCPTACPEYKPDVNNVQGNGSVTFTEITLTSDPLPCDMIQKEADESLISENLDDSQGDYQVLVYPNPNTGKMSIRLTVTELVQDQDVHIQLMSIDGKKVMDVYQGELSTQEISIDASHLASGVYLLQTMTKSQNEIQKIVISKL